MKIGPSTFNQGRGPQYQTWGNIGMGNDNSLLRNIHVNRWNHTLSIHSNKFPENEAGIWLVGISQVDKNTSCLLGCWMEVGWLVPQLACLWGTQLSGISGVSLLLLREPCGEGSPWAGLEVSLLDERGLWPANWGSREGGGLSQMAIGFRGPNPWTLSHCHSDPAEGCSDPFVDANSLRHGESETSLPNSP